MNHFKTYNVTKKDIQKKWYLIDAAGVSMGRVAERAAYILRGKHKAIYTPHLDTGDNVIIINAEKAVFTGSKNENKVYVDFSGFRGGRKERTAKEIRERSPERIIQDAVWGMMPHGRLGRAQYRKLRVYAGSEYPQVAQQPKKVTVK